jgi:hypothetical protein
MKRPYILLAGIAACAVIAAPASAATSTVTGSVTAGTLSVDTDPTEAFGVVLDGFDQLPTYTMPTTVTDATGSNAGWNLTISSTQFTSGAFTIPASASTLDVTIPDACEALSTCTLPTNTIAPSYPLSIPAGGSTVKYFNASANTGMGTVVNTPTVTVAVPANTHEGDYESTLTLTVDTGP